MRSRIKSKITIKSRIRSKSRSRRKSEEGGQVFEKPLSMGRSAPVM